MATTLLEHKVDLSRIYVSLENCETATVGENPGRVLQRLRKHVYDQAPILTKAGDLLGLIYAEDLKPLFEAGLPLDKDVLAIRKTTIPREPALADLLQVMSKNRAVLVTSANDQAERGFHCGAIGLLTVSDLNKPPMQAVLFVILSEIETTLARAIEVAYEEPREWIEFLPRPSQARILGYWEVAKRENMDAGAIQSCNLGDLIAIGRKTKSLQVAIVGISGGNSRCSDALCRLRNRVVHPVAPLLHDQASVSNLYETLTYAVAFRGHLEQLATPRTASLKFKS